MTSYLDLFNSREQSIIIWLIIFFLWTLSKKDIRGSLFNVLKLLSEPKIFTVISSMILYTVLIVTILSKIEIWDINLIKDTILWTFGTAFILLLNVGKASQNERHFKEILLDNLKVILILEFIVNLYAFSLWVELLLVPLLCMVVLTGAVAETKKEHMPVKKASDYILSTFGVFIIIFVSFKTISNYHEIASLGHLRAFMLPPLLTFLYMPFLYFFALIMAYELLFLRLDIFLNKDKKLAKFAKRKIFALCHINLGLLNRFSKESAPALVGLSNETELHNIINSFKKT